MSEQIHQIYHVARCGSTLMTSLLSTVCKAYAEPSWAKSLLLGTDPYKNMESFYGSVVKFPSMTTCFETKFPGNKVFLYRPLAQHLCKIKSVDPLWVKQRFSKTDYILKNHNHPKINWKPEDELDKVTYVWLCSVFRMLDSSNVLWITTNDFLQDKKETLKQVCNHFNLPEVTDFSFCDIDVKKTRLNAKDDTVIDTFNQTEHIEYTFPSYGLIETKMALYDLDIQHRVNDMGNKFSEIEQFLY
jgi:hypothetical protein